MKKLMALVLSFGLVMLGIAPVAASSNIQNIDCEVHVPLPHVAETSEVTLEETQGQVAPEVAMAIRGAVIGGVTAAGAYIADKKLHKEKINYKELAAKTAWGVATGTINGTIDAAAKTIKYAGKAAEYTYKVVKWGAKATFAGIGYIWNKTIKRKR